MYNAKFMGKKKKVSSIAFHSSNGFLPCHAGFSLFFFF